jgi:hypothetical protein
MKASENEDGLNLWNWVDVIYWFLGTSLPHYLEKGKNLIKKASEFIRSNCKEEGNKYFSKHIKYLFQSQSYYQII